MMLIRIDLSRELFTDTGAGTLIRRGNKVQVISKLSELADIEAFKQVLLRGRESPDARAVIDLYVESLSGRDFKCYFDEPMDVLAIVLPPPEGSQLSRLATFTTTESGWLTNATDILFNAIQKDFPKLMWTVTSDDEQLTWFWERADGSLNHKGDVLFWTGLQRAEEVRDLMREFTAQGKAPNPLCYLYKSSFPLAYFLNSSYYLYPCLEKGMLILESARS